MRITATRRRSTEQGGYALILVMVACMIVGVAALASVSRAGVDAARAGSAARAVAAKHNAQSGMEHARALFVRGEFSVADEAVAIANNSAAARCNEGWIATTGNHVATPVQVDGTPMGYSVDLCHATCSSPGAGNDLAAGSHGGTYLVGVSLDVVATGQLPGNRENVTTGGILHVTTTTSAPCN